jgi:hypothetical protein
MCGLFGFASSGRGRVDATFLVECAMGAARRGPDAWAVAHARTGDEGVTERFRGHLEAARLHEILARSEGWPFIVGHCRLASMGERPTPPDCHPFMGSQGIVAHNGTVPDHERVAALYGVADRLRDGIDSEVLSHLTPTQARGAVMGEPHALVGVWGKEMRLTRTRHPLYVFDRPEGVYVCSDPIVAGEYGGVLVQEGVMVKATNASAVQRATPDLSTQPLSAVRWVDPATLKANDYNPNKVFTPELKLLRLSIIENGWTQPIVIRPDGTIVDGFHRFTLGSTDKAVQALTGGLVPVVTLSAELTRADHILATVRHNRARGQHGILAMSKIAKELRADGMTQEEMQERLGMDKEEAIRLLDQRGSPEAGGRDHFGKGWAPVARK